MAQYPPIDYLKGWAPIETHTDEEWDAIAQQTIDESRVPDGDVDSMAQALKASAAREQQLRSDFVAGWGAIEAEAFAMNAEYSAGTGGRS